MKPHYYLLISFLAILAASCCKHDNIPSVEEKKEVTFKNALWEGPIEFVSENGAKKENYDIKIKFGEDEYSTLRLQITNSDGSKETKESVMKCTYNEKTNILDINNLINVDNRIMRYWKVSIVSDKEVKMTKVNDSFENYTASMHLTKTTDI